MKYVITETQFDKLLDLYLSKYLGRKPKIEREENPYNDEGFSIKIKDINDSQLFQYNFFPAGESWDDPSDKIYPANGNLYIREKLVEDLMDFLNVRETKVLDLIADWFTKKYNVDVDNVYGSK
jgi:hypothetical protein